MPNIDIADQTKARLQAIAEPLVDTYDSVIGKLLDQFQIGNAKPSPTILTGQPIGTLDDGRLIFSGANPPKLDFTTCQQIVVGNTQLDKNQTYWNNMLIHIVGLVSEKGHSAGAIVDMLKHSNSVVGEKLDSGYKYLKDVGLSIQGQDSNSAFAQAYFLAAVNGIKGNVFFSWQSNGKAAYPNGRGYIGF
jgi:hypothetical protein